MGGTVQVWVDANSDGITDAGELKALDSLGVVSIDLNAIAQSGEILDGNEVLARGTFTIDPGTGSEVREAVAANFISNPEGHTYVSDGDGTTIDSQSGTSSYVTDIDTGTTIDVTVKGVDSVYGGTSNDNQIYRLAT